MKKNIQLGLLILGLGVGFFAVSGQAQAKVTEAYNSGMQCNSPGNVDDCWFYLEPSGGNDKYKIFWTYGQINVSGNYSSSSVRVDMCFSLSPYPWNGSCWTVVDQQFGNTSRTFTWERDILPDDYSNINYVTIHVRIYNGTSTANVYNRARSVWIESFGSNKSTVNVGQSFTVSWTTSEAQSGVTLNWGGAVGTGEQDYGKGNNSKTFMPTSAGVAQFRLRASGHGYNAQWVTTMDTDSPRWGMPGSFEVTVNAPTPPSPPTANIKCNEGSQVRDNCSWPYGGEDIISWSSTNATSCSVAPSGWTGTSGSQRSGNLFSTTTYTLTCTGAGGSVSDSAIVTIEAPPPSAPTATISANPTSVSYNGSSTITWSSTNTSSCTVSPSNWSGLSGSQSTGALTITTTYTVSCTGAGGSASASVTVTVGSAPLQPAVSISANPTSVSYNGSSTISWSSYDVSSCSVAPSGWSGLSGTYGTGALQITTTYTVSCTGAGGSASNSATVTVGAPPPNAPTASISANPTSVSYNGSSTITWSSTNTSSCTVSPSNWSGLSGSQSTGALTITTTYTVSCTGAGGSASNSATVTVGAQPPSEITFTVTYTSNVPLNTPTNLIVSNSTCGRLALSWTDTNSSPQEDGTNILRSTTPSNFAQVGSVGPNVTTFTDTTAPLDQSYYYEVQVFTNTPARTATSAINGPTRNMLCVANLDNSNKTLLAVNDSAYSASTVIKTGDVLTFQITINNAGPVSATINYLDDVLSSNLSSPANLKVDKDGDGVYNEPGETGTITGTAPNVRLNISGTKGVGNPNWVIKFDATISTNSTSQFDYLSNLARINYTDSLTKTKDVSTGQILFQTGQAKPPNFREVAP